MVGQFLLSTCVTRTLALMSENNNFVFVSSIGLSLVIISTPVNESGNKESLPYVPCTRNCEPNSLFI